MSSLYRKYRPATFSEVVGQDHITSNLQTALTSNRIGHAYLFSGPRGTGKTTFARLLAKAVNCPKRTKTGEPCNVCEFCLEVANGQALDILEIDAASNRGIDEIRALRDTIAVAPLRTKYKVYIIDEVHMLTKEAFNALLKTLEEPPPHVIFILATTELHKVPDTILSRCQRFQFHRASDESLAGLLGRVAKTEKIALDDEAIGLLVRRAEGSFRDSLTLLGSIHAQEKALTTTEIRVLLGLPPQTVVTALREGLASGAPTEVIATLRDFINTGGDAMVLVKAVVEELKAELFSAETLDGPTVSLLEQLLLLLGRARQSPDPTALLSARLFELATAKSSRPNVPVVEQVPAEPKAQPTPEVVPTEAAPTLTDLQKPADTAAETDEVPMEVDAVSAPKLVEDGAFWPNFVTQIKNHNHALYAVIRSAALDSLTDSKLTIAVKFKFYSERLMETKNRRLLEKIGTELAGRPLILDCLVKSDIELPTSGPSEDVVESVVAVFELDEAA